MHWSFKNKPIHSPFFASLLTQLTIIIIIKNKQIHWLWWPEGSIMVIYSRVQWTQCQLPCHSSVNEFPVWAIVHHSWSYPVLIPKLKVIEKSNLAHPYRSFSTLIFSIKYTHYFYLVCSSSHWILLCLLLYIQE